MKQLRSVLLSALAITAFATPSFAGEKPVNISLITPISIFEGMQWGFVNHTANGDGLQLGFVNYAQKLHGIQIGLINIISQDGFFPVFPIVNWSF